MGTTARQPSPHGESETGSRWVLACTLAIGWLAIWLLSGCDIVTRSPMPVKFEVATSKIGNGRMVTLTNESNRILDVYVTQERLKEVVKEGNVALQPGQTVEVGWMGGWRFIALDVIRVEHEDYIPIAEQLK